MEDEVPMMYRGQVRGRCQLHFIEKGTPPDAEKWAAEWTKFYRQDSEGGESNVPLWKQSARISSVEAEAPVFARGIRADEKPDEGFATRDRIQISKVYVLQWRLLNNSGRDETMICPTIGAKGYPYYPGSSMKGAFARACNDVQRDRYCGKMKDGETTPGILRFHGGYPIDTQWTEALVDIIHPQESKQVIDTTAQGAKAQIALYRTPLRFALSSSAIANDDPEWEKIWQIWERTLARGLGGRTSAGYGYVEGITPRKLLTVYLQGRGLAAMRLNSAPELRPNGFKAALRGHALRLFGGMTDADSAKRLTQRLFGGVRAGDTPVVGALGIQFEYEGEEKDCLGTYEYRNERMGRPVSMNTYKLEKATLRIIADRGDGDRDTLQAVARALVRFALLLGGFGKSWRRADHTLFYPDYLRGKKKPLIGCHWRFRSSSRSLYSSFDDIARTIDEVREVLRWWAAQYETLNGTAGNWREAWFEDNVQVWGRIAKKRGDSRAICWFHGTYEGDRSIKGSSLTGSLGKTGRIWHRMYPHYVMENGELKNTKQYVELLTVFTEETETCAHFLDYLWHRSEFERLWGGA